MRHARPLLTSLLIALASTVALLGQDSQPPTDDSLTLFRGDRTRFRGDRTRLAVVCLNVETGETISGATVILCREGANDGEIQDPCRILVADSSGSVEIPDLNTGQYFVRATLSGFADTVVGPLGIGDVQPRAPRQVVLVLNPVCSDC